MIGAFLTSRASHIDPVLAEEAERNVSVIEAISDSSQQNGEWRGVFTGS